MGTNLAKQAIKAVIYNDQQSKPTAFIAAKALARQAPVVTLQIMKSVENTAGHIYSRLTRKI